MKNYYSSIIFFLLMILLVLLFFLPDFTWGGNLVIEPIMMTIEWKKGIFEIFKIFLTFLIVTYFWDKFKKNQRFNEIEEKVFLLIKDWYKLKGFLLKDINDLISGIEDPTFIPLDFTVKLKQHKNELFQVGNQLLKYKSGSNAVNTEIYNVIRNASPIIKEIIIDLEKEKIIRGRSFTDNQTKKIKQLIMLLN